MKNLPYLFIIATIVSCSIADSGHDDGADSGYLGNYSGLYADEFAGPVSGDKYNEYDENPFISVEEQPISTFSIDADGGSYANARRFITEGQLPPASAIRTEEIINYFNLNYPENTEGHPVSVNGEVAMCLWEPGHKLVRIGLKGQSIPRNELPPSNFVFLIDVSGSMSSSDKLELLKDGFKLLVDEMDEEDRIAIVTYAGSAGVVLESTPCNEKSKIKDAIRSLGAGGSTAGAQGIITAYEIAQENFIEGGNNRIIIGTDGDFNVGPSSQEELVTMIEEKRELGIFITVIGVGRGNLNDGMLEQIANNGNGTYEYIDNLTQAQKVFIYEFNKFYTAAKDVKVQVEFYPSMVDRYRLIGYENRLLNEEDFEDDEKDAGEIAIGQNITALYEIIPRSTADFRNPTFTIDFRYKRPDEDTSIPISLDIMDDNTPFLLATDEMIFTASAAGFGLMLIDSEYKGDLTYDDLIPWVQQSMDYDPYGLKSEFLELIEEADQLSN